MSILAILNMLIGALLLLGAVALFLSLLLVGDPIFQEALAGEVPDWIMASLATILAVLGAVLLVMGALALLLAYGFLNGKRWSWFLGVVYGFLSIALSVISVIGSGGLLDFLTLGFSIAIPVLILVYLFQPHVKAWFGA